jgi:hypothetical protein
MSNLSDSISSVLVYTALTVHFRVEGAERDRAKTLSISGLGVHPQTNPPSRNNTQLPPTRRLLQPIHDKYGGYRPEEAETTAPAG